MVYQALEKRSRYGRNGSPYSYSKERQASEAIGPSPETLIYYRKSNKAEVENSINEPDICVPDP